MLKIDKTGWTPELLQRDPQGPQERERPRQLRHRRVHQQEVKRHRPRRRQEQPQGVRTSPCQRRDPRYEQDFMDPRGLCRNPRHKEMRSCGAISVNTESVLEQPARIDIQPQLDRR